MTATALMGSWTLPMLTSLIAACIWKCMSSESMAAVMVPSTRSSRCSPSTRTSQRRKCFETSANTSSNGEKQKMGEAMPIISAPP